MRSNQLHADHLREEFSPANLERMRQLRFQMDQLELHWALFSFHNLESNLIGPCGGVYELYEGSEVIYISAIPEGVHIRDALNAHFWGQDGLPLGQYLALECIDRWRDFQVRFLPSGNARDDARLLLRYYQLNHKGQAPPFN